MTNTNVKWLRARLTRLEAERERMNQDIAAYHRVLADAEREEAASEFVSPAKSAVNQMWRILEEVGRPLHYRDIYQQLQDRGIQVQGLDPLKNVGAHMSADPRFVSDGKGFWRLTSWGPDVIRTPRPPERDREEGVAPAHMDTSPPRPSPSDQLIDDVVSRFSLPDSCIEDLKRAIAKQDKYEVKRMARLLPNGQSLPFLAELRSVIDVIDGQQSA
jgi:hypothetical protein